MRNRNIVLLAVVWMVLVVAGVSSAVTLSVSSGSRAATENDDSVTISRAEYDALRRYERLETVRGILESDYYLPLDEDALLTGAVRGMMDAVDDPYTYYYTPEEMREATERNEGAYEGLGLLLSADKDGLLIVLRVFKDSPAVSADIRPYDRILSVNGVPVSAENNKAMDDAIRLIRDSAEKEFVVTLSRDGLTHSVTLTKRVVNINRVDYRMLDEEIGYIAIYEFLGNDVSGFLEARRALTDAGCKALVLDLRDNPGGLLNDVVRIADELVPEGLIVYTEDRNGEREEFAADGAYWDIPVAVLVNGMSASASEVLTGALKDTGRATVVGETTFGKGIVQTVIPFRTDGAGMQLTTARYFTPAGRCIHGTGITPDETVPPEDIVGNNQLEYAARLLRTRLGEAKTDVVP